MTNKNNTLIELLSTEAYLNTQKVRKEVCPVMPFTEFKHVAEAVVAAPVTLPFWRSLWFKFTNRSK